MPPDIPSLDKSRLWHPFTQMREWCDPHHEPLIIESGKGAVLVDSQGNEYIDGNSSIWTNIHGHNHPAINAAIETQLKKIAHASFLGFTNNPAVLLADALVNVAPTPLTRVFYTDDGSTAIECAIKMAIQYWQQTGSPERREFVSFTNAYHGDTLGAATLGGIPGFHDRFSSFGLVTHFIGRAGELEALPGDIAKKVAAVTIEPLIQGAAGMRLWPPGMLRRIRQWCDRTGAFLICDEVMTGFGRTGTLFACEREEVAPDFLALAKGLTGGYLPLAATLTTDRVFDAFLGNHEEDKTFFYGHSYCGNPLGCAAALASLKIFKDEATLERLAPKIALLAELLEELRASSENVGDIRQCGFIAGIDIVKDSSTGEPFPPEARAGRAACLAARKFGLLTRPIGDTVVLMPPLCASTEEISAAVRAIGKALSLLRP